jgi:hypothetical protein
MRYDRQWARGASSEELLTVVSDTPTSCEPTVDWRAVTALREPNCALIAQRTRLTRRSKHHGL